MSCTNGQIHCHAYNGPCGQGCFLQHACKTTPEKVMAVIERLDAQTVSAMTVLIRR